jgi:hypothetical protein
MTKPRTGSHGLRGRCFPYRKQVAQFCQCSWLGCVTLINLLRLRFEEREKVGVDDVGLCRDHAMRVVLERLQRAVLEELG